MLKILLIGINARYSHPTVALYYLRTFVRNLPIVVCIEEYTIRNNVKEIAESIYKQNPDVVGLSVYIWNSIIIKQLIDLLSKDKRFVIILGGPEVSYNASVWLKNYPAIDYIITGHGEEGFRRLIESNFNLKENIIKSNNPPFAEMPFPYIDEDFENFKNKNIYYESSRGCPFNCAYCISSCDDQRLEFRTLKQVHDEIENIMRYFPRLVKFIDRTFNAQSERARAIWEMLLAQYSGYCTTFHFEIHPAFLTGKDFSLLKKVPKGLFQFEIGIQTVHKEVRDEVDRKGEWEKEQRAIEALRAMNNIHLHVDLIAGLPNETFNMLRDSFNKVYYLGADHFQLGILKLLPGTKIRQKANEYEMIFNQEAPYEVWQNKWITENEMQKIRKIARLVDALYNSHRFHFTIKELISRFASPWHLYCALAHAANRDLSDVSWLSMYAFLMDFVSKEFCDEIDFFKDCLAYDWFSSFTTHRVPAIFKTAAYREIKERVCKIIKNRMCNCDENIEKLKSYKIMIPISEKFKNKYIDGGDVVAFLEGGERVIIYKEDLWL